MSGKGYFLLKNILSYSFNGLISGSPTFYVEPAIFRLKRQSCIFTHATNNVPDLLLLK